MDNELYLCRIKNEYLKYLHRIDTRVSVKYNNRPFVGVITMINNIKYVIPLTSQTTQKREKAGKKKRSARITTYVRDGSGVEIANILYNNMIPIISGQYEHIDIDAEKNTYESNEIRFIRKNKEKIINKAHKVYNDRINKNDNFLNIYCCDFKKLEEGYMLYEK